MTRHETASEAPTSQRPLTNAAYAAGRSLSRPSSSGIITKLYHLHVRAFAHREVAEHAAYGKWEDGGSYEARGFHVQLLTGHAGCATTCPGSTLGVETTCKQESDTSGKVPPFRPGLVSVGRQTIF